MESIFNIFGSEDERITLQRPASSSGAFFDVGPQKLRAKSDSSNVYSKRVLGDIRNTLQQTHKKAGLKENAPFKGKKEDSVLGGSSRTPLLPRPQVISITEPKLNSKSLFKNQTPGQKKLFEVPKSVQKFQSSRTTENSAVKCGAAVQNTNCKLPSVSREALFSPTDLQGPDLIKEDNYGDILALDEHPSLGDYKRIAVFEDDSQHLDVFESPQIPLFIKDSALDSFMELPEPDIQGPTPEIEDTDEDIWPVCERPVLDDFKRIMVFWNNSEQPDKFEFPSISEFVGTPSILLDCNLVLPQCEDLDQDVPYPVNLEVN